MTKTAVAFTFSLRLLWRGWSFDNSEQGCNMVLRYALANVAAETLAALGQGAGLAGSVSSGFGFGAWGVEPTAFLEVATEDAARVDAFVWGVLRQHGEQAAYRTENGGAPALLWAEVPGPRLEPLAAGVPAEV